MKFFNFNSTVIVYLLCSSLSYAQSPNEPNLALSKPVVVSSTEVGFGNEKHFAVDGDVTTRWSSGYSDPEWMYVDLGKIYDINRVKINWEAAYSTAYDIQVSVDAANWTTIYSTTTGNGGIDNLAGLTGTGQYLRVYGRQRSLQYGHSIWELEVYGTDSGTNPPQPSKPNLALTKTVSVSSTETGFGNEAHFAVDGKASTRWSSDYVDPSWISVDLGKNYDVNQVKINWEAAYSTAYEVQVSTDAASWTSIYSTTTGNGGVDDLTGLTGTGRYVRIYGTQRSLQYGHSIWELEVFGKESGTNPPPVACKPTASADDGNVAANVADKNLATRWSANGDGQWIQLCVGDNKTIRGAKIAFYKGDVRSNLFDLQVSTDGQAWKNVATSLSSATGKLGLQTFKFTGEAARFIRYLGHGNTANTWNSITEFEAITGAEPPPPPSVWKKANLTWYESYPDPGSPECTEFNGCKWAGYFAFVDGKQTEDWVKARNIAAVHSKDAATYKLKTLRLRQGTKEIDVKVYDMCADSDCNGCCTTNARENGLNFLIDIEKYTVQRFGSSHGIVEWSCLDCK